MSICTHGRSIGNCPLCPVVAAEPVRQPVLEILAATTTTSQNYGPLPVVQNTDKPDITDPAAKSVLVLAQTYAQAQDDLATVSAAVTNTESLLRGLRRDLADAEKKCAAAQQALHSAVTPTTPRVPKAPRQKKPKQYIAVPWPDIARCPVCGMQYDNCTCGTTT